MTAEAVERVTAFLDRRDQINERARIKYSDEIHGLGNAPDGEVLPLLASDLRILLDALTAVET
jgi:hypothetical protein